MTDFIAIDFETANECPSSVCSIGAVLVRDGEIVKVGTVLEITISAGGEVVYLPLLVGMSEEEAIATIEQLGLNYEIKKAWESGKGIVGIYIHGLKNASGEQAEKGENPLKDFCIDKTLNYIAHHSNPADDNEINLSKVCKAYDTPYKSSEYVYGYIKDHISDWIEEAIEIRNNYPK